MKIAIATEDSNMVSDHLGGAPYFVVVTVEEGKVVNKETRDKPGHKEYAGSEEHPPLDKSGSHGFGPEATERHHEICKVIEDCDVLIAGRMGLGAYGDFRQSGLEVIATDVTGIDEAIALYLEDKLPHTEDRVC